MILAVTLLLSKFRQNGRLYPNVYFSLAYHVPDIDVWKLQFIISFRHLTYCSTPDHSPSRNFLRKCYMRVFYGHDAPPPYPLNCDLDLSRKLTRDSPIRTPASLLTTSAVAGARWR